MPVPAMRRMTPAGVTSRITLSPLSAMNTSPLASTAVPPGWYSDAPVAGPPSPCSPNAVSDPANAVVAPPAMAAIRLAPVSETYTVPPAAETPTGLVQAAAGAGGGVGQGLQDRGGGGARAGRAGRGQPGGHGGGHGGRADQAAPMTQFLEFQAHSCVAPG